MRERSCEHLANVVDPAEPKGNVCQTCVEMGDTWVHLRSCLECGTVGCCDNSKNRHARRHWEEQVHPLIRSIEPGETWRFCFEDEAIVL